MKNNSEYPAIIPYLMVKDVDRAIDFYQKAFGFTLPQEPMRDQDGTASHAEMRYNDCVIMVGKEGAYGFPHRAPRTSGIPSPISLYVYYPDIDAQYEHAIKNGATSLAAPEDMFWGDRMARLTDPDGYEWSIATQSNWLKDGKFECCSCPNH